jgi:tetratricopeptide (TPR) repeat protein
MNDNTTIDSTILFRGEDGKQRFVHDSYLDYFVANWLDSHINNVGCFWQNVISFLSLPSYNKVDLITSSNSIKVLNIGDTQVFQRSNESLLSDSKIVFFHQALHLYCESVNDISLLIEEALISIQERDANDLVRLHIFSELLLLINDSYNINESVYEKFIVSLLKEDKDLNLLLYPHDTVLSSIISKGSNPEDYYMKAFDKDQAYFKLGMDYLDLSSKQANYEALALKYFKLAIINNPFNLSYYIQLGDSLMRLGNYSEAKRLFLRVTSLDIKKLDEPKLLPIILKGFKTAQSGLYNLYWKQL